MDIFQESSKNDKKDPISTTGRIILGLTGGIALGLTLISSSFVRPAFRKYCLPYIPATDEQIKNVLTALKTRKGYLLDLGSGDGRIVIGWFLSPDNYRSGFLLETAKVGFTSHGVELNTWLVLYSKLDAWRKGLRKKTDFFQKDLWKYDVSRYDYIVIFGVEQMMAKLEEKLGNECKNGCNIVACRFPLPLKIPLVTIGSGVDTVWVYKIQNKEQIQDL